MTVRRVDVDARWLMAFAASIGDTKPVHLDTTVPGGIVGHPLFGICAEWPLLRDLDLSRLGGAVEGTPLFVHGAHDVTIRRLVRPGDRLVSTSLIGGIEAKTSGVLVHYLLETVDAEGLPVSSSRYGIYALGTRLVGAPVPITGETPLWGVDTFDLLSPDYESAVELGAGLAHTYTECARIFNPIHTDTMAAHAAGLKGPILHGSATLATAVSTIVDQACGGDPAALARVTARFASTVTLPCTLRVRWQEAKVGVIPFRVLGPGDIVVVDRASVTLRKLNDEAS